MNVGNITDEQYKALTESKFFVPEIGTDVVVKIDIDSAKYEEKIWKPGEEPRASLSVRIIGIDGTPTNKVFTVQKKSNCKIILDKLQRAKDLGNNVEYFEITRPTRTNIIVK